MLAKDIATEFRTQVDDTDVDDPLWTDAEVIRYMNLAINEVAKKTLCITDSSTASVVQLTVTQDDPWVPHSDLILEFEPPTLYSTTLQKNYPIVSFYEFESKQHGDDYGLLQTVGDNAWQLKTGNPRLYISGLNTEQLRAYPIPTAADTLTASVKRLPINAITDIAPASIEVPEVSAKFHEDLVVYMSYRAYLKQDAECYDKGLSDRYLQEWELNTLPEIKELLKRTENSKRFTTRYAPNG